MAFDLDKFRETQFEQRVEVFEIPALAPFFDEGEKPEIMIRALTASELAYIETEITRNRAVRQAAASEAVSGEAGEMVGALMQAIGIMPDTVPDHHVGRLITVRLGVAEPELSREDALRLAEHFPNEFTRLSEAIQQLTLMGADVKKSTSSGETPG